MMRRFKALKRSSIAKSTPSLNNLDFSETGVSVRPIPSSISSNDQQLEEDGSSLLDGVIDLSVLLPDGKQVRMPIDGRTPMMDVLVQVATENGINAGGMILKVPIDRPPGYLHYKPNMPIGKLGCTTVEVVPKAAVCDRPRKHQQKGPTLPFEPTVRIQINLPKNQKTVLRVSPQSTLGEILHRVCEETNLEPASAYELRAAKSTGFPLCLNRRLGEVGIVDFTIVAVGSSVCKSTSDILGAISKMSQEEKEKRKTRRFFGLLRRKPAPPQPVGRIEIQKTTLNGQAAVEMRTPEKKRAAAKDRPLSMPPSFFDTSDGETSAETSQRRDVAAKPKKRQAPLPPAIVQPPEDTAVLKNRDVALSSSSVGRSQHARRGSDSSSGYHGSSQPSPNPPPIGDISGAIIPTFRNASGSEKSSYSYKSRNSGEGSILQSINGVKDDALESAAQKKKTKAPLPPAISPGPGALVEDSSSVSRSPVAQRSSLVKDDSAPTTDSRCSSPATAEDVDKNFQEVIQQIQKQISAEDDAAATRKVEEPVVRGQNEYPNSDAPQQEAAGESIRPEDNDSQVSSDVVVSKLVIAKPNSFIDNDGDAERSAHKPTDLDDPVAVSFAQLRLSWGKEKDALTRDDQISTPYSKSEATEDVSMNLPLQTGGLLMIKPNGGEEVNEQSQSLSRHSKSKASADDLEKERSQMPSQKEDPPAGIKQVSSSHSTPTDLFQPERVMQKEVDVGLKLESTKENGDYGKAVRGGYTKVEVVERRQSHPSEHSHVSTQGSRPSTLERAEKRTIATTTLVFKTELLDTPSPARSSSPSSPSSSVASGIRWPSGTKDVTSPRPSIVYNDPKKDLYPSMQVKSFEDEYYTKRQGSVANDYVKAVRYGMVGEFSTGKEEREKNREKLEATVAKRANASIGGITSERWQNPMVNGGPLQSNGVTSKMAPREDISRTPSTIPAPANVSIQLQREYEKLQAMFADWQFRLKQHEAIADSGRKVSPEQELAFQRLQDEMMKQHRYVQGICADAQKLEKDLPSFSSTAGPMAIRLESLQGSTNATTTNSGLKQMDKRQSGLPLAMKKAPAAENVSVMGSSSVPKSVPSAVQTATKFVTLSQKPTKQDQPQIDASSATKPSMLYTTKRQSATTATNGSVTDSAKIASNSGQKLTYSTKWTSPVVESAVERPRVQSNGFLNGSVVKRYEPTTPASTQPVTAQSGRGQESIPSVVKYSSTVSPTAPPPPPPPPIMPAATSDSKGSSSLSSAGVALKPVSNSLKSSSVNRSQVQRGNDNGGSDPRGDLMASIRSFGGSSGLKKVSPSS